jgi:hypothetical protein
VSIATTVAEGRSAINRRIALFVLIGLVLLYTAAEGVWSGWHRWLPGSMSRHRDAAAVAITAVAYDKWQGYASYREVNRVLREHGLSVHPTDLERVGAKHYFDVMTDAIRLNAALTAAASLHEPAAGGMYYSQDEKGMATFFIAAFRLFGVSASSWYWLYMALYSLSVLVACAAFRRRADVLFFVLALVSAHAIAAGMLPDIPRQDINVVHGNRFLGILASVAMCHLMFLILFRVHPSVGQVGAAAFPVALICLAINARTSVAWTLIGVVVLWLTGWLAWLVQQARHRETARPVSWPIIAILAGLAALALHNRFVQDSAYRDGRAHGGHVFWHSLVTALHNHPSRTERYGIPKEFPIYDDQVAYVLFDREIARRGEERSRYLVGDADWIYRTSSPDLDLRWEPYDKVLRDVFLRTVTEDPAYAAYAFLVQQPVTALRIVFNRDFLRSRKVLDVVSLLTIGLGVLLAAHHIAQARTRYLAVLAAASVCVMLPVLTAAVVELRVIELFYVLLVDAVIAAALITVMLKQWVSARGARA